MTINVAVENMSKTIASGLEKTDDGKYVVGKDTMGALLKENDLDMKTIKQVDTFTTNLSASMGMALGEVSVAAMKKDKGLSETNVKATLGAHRLESTFHRSKQVPKGFGGDGGTVEKKGFLHSKILIKANGATFKEVKEHVADLAKDL